MKRANLILFGAYNNGADQPLHSRSLNSTISFFDCMVRITAFHAMNPVSYDLNNIVQRQRTLYLIETPFNTFANRVDPDQAALKELPDQGLLCLLMEI